MKNALKSITLTLAIAIAGFSMAQSAHAFKSFEAGCSGSGDTCTVSGFGSPFDGSYHLDYILITY